MQRSVMNIIFDPLCNQYYLIHCVISTTWSTSVISLSSSPVSVRQFCFLVDRIKCGGVKSGFNHVERGIFQPRLIQVKGKRNPRFSEVSSWSEVCFLQKREPFIYLWEVKSQFWYGLQSSLETGALEVHMLQWAPKERNHWYTSEILLHVVSHHCSYNSNATWFFKYTQQPNN